ncbi:MAG: histidine kinase [Bacteroidales bacterium]
MIPFIYSKWYWRMMAGVFSGLITWLLAEILLNIRYRYFDLFSQPLNYLYAAVFGLIIMELVVLINMRLEHRFPWTRSPGKRWLVQTLAGIAVAVIWISVVRNLIHFIFLPGQLVILEDELMLIILITLLIIVFNLAELGFFLNDRYHRSVAEMERFRKESAEYQFEMLKLQLNPHFLFNSLNTLSSLIYEDAGKAASFIRKLSDVYRYVLDNRNKELVTLQEEEDFISSFTFLLQIRFRDMIHFNFEISQAARIKRLAPMTLQLLVENAVKHNVVSMKKPLTIVIFANEDYLTVSNNLQVKGKTGGTGVGLKNIASRYAFLTDREVVIEKDDRHFTVKVPLIP